MNPLPPDCALAAALEARTKKAITVATSTTRSLLTTLRKTAREAFERALKAGRT